MISVRDIVTLKFNGSYRTPEMIKQVKMGHPFVIINEDKNTINVVEISSQVTQEVKDGKYPQDYVIEDISVCGLSKPSYVCCDCRGIILKKNIYKKFGTMSEKDFKEVVRRVKRFPRRKILESYKIYNTGEPEYLDYFYDENGTIEYLL